jgi:hypothetical protein
VAKGATLALKITGDASDASRALGDVEGKAGKFGKAMGVAGAAAGAAVAAIGGIAVAAFNAASALEQSTGAIDSVFGDWAIDIEQAADAAVALGLSKNSYQELAAVIGSQLKNAGMSIGDVTDNTQDLIAKGSDMAAVFGGSAADAVGALSSALKGEMDPIERYGVTLNQAAIDAKLAALGLDGLEGSAAQAAKTQAVLALINEQTAQTMGATARESDTAAGKMAQLSAWWENAKATLGEKLLPVFVTFATFLQDKVAPVIERLTAEGGPLSAMFATVAGFVTGQLVPALTDLWNELSPKLLPILETVGGIITGHLVPAFQAIWGVVQQYVVPILKSVLGPALDGLKAGWDKIAGALDANRDKFAGLLDNVRPLLDFLKNTVAPFIGGALKRGFETLGDVIGGVVDAIAWVLDKASAVAGFIGDVGSFLFGAPAAGPGGAPAAAGLFGAAGGGLLGASPRLLGAAPGPGGAGQARTLAAGDTYVVNVSGALDPTAVADQIAAMLDRRARRIGLVPAGAR